MLKKLLVSVALLAAVPAFAQSVQESGTVTRGHASYWVTSGVIGDAGSAADSPVTSFGVTNPGGSGICVSSDRQTAAGRNQLCFGASTTGPATISLQNYGTASPQNLQFVINGTPVTIPTGGTSFLQLSGAAVSGHLPCFSGTLGLVVDCGTSIGAGTQYGIPYYSTTSSLGSTGAGTNGQFLIGQTGSVPLWDSLSGDVGSVTAGGALTLAKVNGIPFAATYTSHGVLLGQGTNVFNSLTTSNVGQCLLSQGVSSDPVWSSCASGSGSAGGSNTQVQFNNTTALAGSANLTWVSPALTIGSAGSVVGQLALATNGGSGTVTVQNPSTTSAYNFNLPTTAGSLGQPLLSGGGGSTAMSFGTLGIAGGGTNCAAASGTCLDNITGFSSTGYLNRTGGGTYAFSLVIPVSGGGTALANGTSGGILGFTGTGTIASSALLAQYGIVVGGGAGSTPTAITNGTAGQLLIAQTSANPAWSTLSGDATINNAGALTIANSAVTVAKQANAAAWTLEGNFTSGSAAPQFSTIGALTQKASPAASDLILIQDQAAAGAYKYATVSSVSSAGSVASIAGNTGAFTLGAGLTNATNVLLADPLFFQNYITGLTLSTAGSSSTFGIAVGVATDSTNVSIMRLPSAFTKTTSAWTVGTGNGALDTGSIANATWYSVFEIQRTDTGLVDILVSTSATSPILPASYTLSRRIGSMLTNGSAQWVLFTQIGNQFLWSVPYSDASPVNGSTTATSLTLTVPLGVKVTALMSALGLANSSNDGRYWVYSLDQADTSLANSTMNVGASGSGGIQSDAQLSILTNTSAQIRYRSFASTAQLYISTQGWIDLRGQK